MLTKVLISFQCSFMKVRNAACRCSRPYEQMKSPHPSASRYSAIQCSPYSSPSSVLHTNANGKATIVVGSPSLGGTPRNIDLVRGSIASSLAICRVSISVVVDGFAALVYFQYGLELGVGDDVHSGR